VGSSLEFESPASLPWAREVCCNQCARYRRIERFIDDPKDAFNIAVNKSKTTVPKTARKSGFSLKNPAGLCLNLGRGEGSLLSITGWRATAGLPN
jgi:hypothetical protein